MCSCLECIGDQPEPSGLSDSDVFTLMGHAEILRGNGQSDMPAYLWGLAARIAEEIGDKGLEQRVRALTPVSASKGV